MEGVSGFWGKFGKSQITNYEVRKRETEIRGGQVFALPRHFQSFSGSRRP